MFKLQFRDVGWWYWLATVGALTFGVAGSPHGFPAALGITVVHLLHYVVLKRSVSAFPVQVRLTLVVFMLIGLLEPMTFIYWMLFVGGLAQVLFGYCLMARLVSLFPWNSTAPMSVGLLKTTFLSRPTVGDVRQGFAASEP